MHGVLALESGSTSSDYTEGHHDRHIDILQGVPMSRDDDWDEDDDRPRRRRRRAPYDEDEDDEFDDDVRLQRGRGQPRSGAVTGVGIISIILGGVDLLFGACMLLGLLFIGEAPGGGGLVGGHLAVAILVSLVLVVLLWGALAITSGIGVLNRHNWGRVMTLILSGIAAAVGVFCLIGAVGVLAVGGNGQGAPDDVFLSMIYVFLAALLISYCIMAYVVLLNSRNRLEFH